MTRTYLDLSDASFCRIFIQDDKNWVQKIKQWLTFMSQLYRKAEKVAKETTIRIGTVGGGEVKITYVWN